jgi:transposase-like protein
MAIERPQGVHREWCPDCGDEMLFSGTQSAGYAQYFCQNCRYRHDVYVGEPAVEASATDEQVTATGDRS